MSFSFNDIIFSNEQRKPDDYAAITKELKRDILKSLALAGSGHPGGALGIAELMAVLHFGGVMRYDATNPTWKERDRFILSPGHYVPVLYSCLAHCGYFPTSELATLRKLGTRLQGHPAGFGFTPGIETTTGSLGQGVSIAVGMAMSDKLIDKNSHKVFCLSGDGELQEGSCWEAAMSASMHHLDNLCWIVDNNDCQIDGRVKEVMSIYPLKEKFESFGFAVIELNGNDVEQVISGYEQFNANHKNKINKPTCIIAKTIMGNEISLMHDKYQWHGNPPTIAQAEEALKELEDTNNE
ncbi:MAG: transketolase [Ignavibacteria bacterium]|jgi:transketolase|nr:transketolase [Ignavibacteria bacterium]